MDDERVRGRLAALFLGGCVAFGYPVLAAFNVTGTVFGLPVLYVYVFGAWMALIALVAAIVRRRD
jgi:hypothetical protein